MLGIMYPEKGSQKNGKVNIVNIVGAALVRAGGLHGQPDDMYSYELQRPSSSGSCLCMYMFA